MAIRSRVRKKGRVWQVYWNNPHTGKRESASFDTIHKARAHDAEVKRRLEEDRASFGIPDESAPPVLTFAGIAAKYLAASPMTPDSRKVTFYAFRAHVLPLIGAKPAGELSKADMREIERRHLEKGAKRQTVSRTIAMTKAALNWAVEAELIPSNPVARYVCKRGKDEVPAPPTLAEVQAIIDQSQPYLVRAVLVAWFLGVRVGPSELFRLAWKDVDWRCGLIRVWSAKKNPGAPYRDVALSPDAYALLEGWQTEDAGMEQPPAWIVHKRGAQVLSINKAWWKACAKAGITRRLRPYDLRHAFATHALAAGADLKAVSQVMGHADARMILRTYQHVQEAQVRDAVARIPSPCAHVPSGHMRPAENAGNQGFSDVPENSKVQ